MFNKISKFETRRDLLEKAPSKNYQKMAKNDAQTFVGFLPHSMT